MATIRPSDVPERCTLFEVDLPVEDAFAELSAPLLAQLLDFGLRLLEGCGQVLFPLFQAWTRIRGPARLDP